jgi:hypothetical protein
MSSARARSIELAKWAYLTNAAANAPLLYLNKDKANFEM